MHQLIDNTPTEYLEMVRVYQFMRPADGLTALRDQRLKISRLDQLNDPFEFFAADLRNRAKRETLIRTKAQLAKQSGLLCFSKDWRNPVLWSHYSDRHKGLCLGFDLPEEKLHHVAYVQSRIPWPSEVTEAFTQQLLFTKFAHWSYEDEYRAWAPLEIEINGNYYVDFSEQLVLKQVLVGAESTITRTDINNALAAKKADIEMFKVRAAFRSFRIVHNKDESQWT